MISKDILIQYNKEILEEEGVFDYAIIGEEELQVICEREYDDPLDFGADVMLLCPFEDGHHRTMIRALWNIQDDMDEDFISRDFDTAYLELEERMDIRPHPPVEYGDVDAAATSDNR